MPYANTARLSRFWLLITLLAALQLSGCAITFQLSEADQQKIAGKTYVITDASSGLGRGVAVKLASMRTNVVFAARRSALLNVVASEGVALGGTPLVVTADVSQPDDIQRLAESTIARFGRIDV